MIWPSDARYIQSNNFVTGQLVNKCISMYQYLSCSLVETIDDAVVFGGFHLFGHRCGATHISKEQGHLDFNADLVFSDNFLAAIT